MDAIRVSEVDHCRLRVDCGGDDGLRADLYEHFSFVAGNARWDPRVRNGVWDGRIRLFDRRRCTLYRGLLMEACAFLAERGYRPEVDPGLVPRGISHDEDDLTEWATGVSRAAGRELRDYQLESFLNAVRTDRSITLSPTASGKSLSIFLVGKLYAEASGRPTLVIVPTVTLVEQMERDFREYDPETTVYSIRGGVDRHGFKRVQFVVTTWQSAAKEPAEWFSRFNAVIGDEVHTFGAKSLVQIMERASTVRYRHGFTGTLEDVNRMQLVGLFGPIRTVATTRELIDRGLVSPVRVRVLQLGYDPADRSALMERTDGGNGATGYAREIEWLVAHPGRNAVLRDLLTSLDETVVALFKRVEHGRTLSAGLTAAGVAHHLVYGGTEAAQREEIRRLAQDAPGAKILASVGVFATGTNIPRIEHVVLAHPMKSRIQHLQSIGRGLRLHEGKSQCVVWDVADDLRIKRRSNFAWKHFQARMERYSAEEFPCEVLSVEVPSASR